MSGKSAVEDLLATPEPPELGPGPRAGVQTKEALERALDGALGKSFSSGHKEQLIRALILLWHDHLDAAHVIARNAENPDGAFVHGIVHRREPDFTNARYWFRRVGRHPAFPEIGRRVKALLESNGNQGLGEKLASRSQWDALAFIDLCEQAAGRKPSEVPANLLREIQRIETEALLAVLCG
jgi:hypothetical protein